MMSLFDGVASGLTESEECRAKELDDLFRESESEAYAAAKQARDQHANDGTFAYGEIEIASFVGLVQEILAGFDSSIHPEARAAAEEESPVSPQREFWDLGSGSGKAVLAAHSMVPSLTRPLTHPMIQPIPIRDAPLGGAKVRRDRAHSRAARSGPASPRHL